MAIFLSFDGIEGDVTAKGFEKWISVDTFSFGVNRAISMETGNMANRVSSKPNFDMIRLSKPLDSSAITLFKEATTGAEGKTATIKLMRTDKDELKAYMGYILKGAMISDYDVSAHGDEPAMEQFSLSFSGIETVYEGATTLRDSYNLATASAK